MAYSTLADIKKLIPEETLVQLTDDEGLAKINQARVDEAIAQADAEIDAYLGARYTVPFAAPVPALPARLSSRMAVYHLYARKVEEIPKTRVDQYNNVLRVLEKIAEGKISIGDESADEGTNEVQYSGEDRIFTRDKLTGF